MDTTRKKRASNSFPRIILTPDVFELWGKEKNTQGFADKTRSEFASYLLNRSKIDSSWETSVVETEDEGHATSEAKMEIEEAIVSQPVVTLPAAASIEQEREAAVSLVMLEQTAGTSQVKQCPVEARNESQLSETAPAESTAATLSATEESPNKSIHFRIDPTDPTSEPSPKRYVTFSILFGYYRFAICMF